MNSFGIYTTNMWFNVKMDNFQNGEFGFFEYLGRGV